MASLTYRMDRSKDLVATSTTKIYQNEKNVDSIIILLPQNYGDLDLGEFTVKIKYADLMNVLHTDELERDEELYQDMYYRFVFPITDEFTKIAGEITFMLDVSQGEEQILHTGSATVTILPWKDYVPFEEG